MVISAAGEKKKKYYDYAFFPKAAARKALKVHNYMWLSVVLAYSEQRVVVKSAKWVN